MQMKFTASGDCKIPVPLLYLSISARQGLQLSSLGSPSKAHPLLCPTQNTASVSLIKWARELQWMVQAGEDTLKENYTLQISDNM